MQAHQLQTALGSGLIMCLGWACQSVAASELTLKPTRVAQDDSQSHYRLGNDYYRQLDVPMLPKRNMNQVFTEMEQESF